MRSGNRVCTQTESRNKQDQDTLLVASACFRDDGVALQDSKHEHVLTVGTNTLDTVPVKKHQGECHGSVAMDMWNVSL